MRQKKIVESSAPLWSWICSVSAEQLHALDCSTCVQFFFSFCFCKEDCYTPSASPLPPSSRCFASALPCWHEINFNFYLPETEIRVCGRSNSRRGRIGDDENGQKSKQNLSEVKHFLVASPKIASYLMVFVQTCRVQHRLCMLRWQNDEINV